MVGNISFTKTAFGIEAFIPVINITVVMIELAQDNVNGTNKEQPSGGQS